MKKKGLIMAITAASLWGVSGNLAEYILTNSNFNVINYTSFRMFFTGIILLLYGISITGFSEIYKIFNIKTILKLALYGFIGISALQYSFAQTIAYSNAPFTTLMQYLTPTVVLVYLSIKNRTLPSIKKILLIISALFGMFLMITDGNINSLNVSITAIFYGLIAAFTFAFYILYVDEFKGIDNTIVIGSGMIIGTLAFLPFIDFNNLKEILEIKVFLAFASNITFGNAIPFYLFLESTRYISPTTTSLLGALEPIVAIIIGILFLNTQLSSLQIFGATLLIASVTIISIFED